MRGAKRYTNETFTKRVDHEAGKHRQPKAMPEPAICTVCGDIYADRRWVLPDEVRTAELKSATEPPAEVVCPACDRQKTGVPSGYLHLDGGFVKAHWPEIENLITNEVARVNVDNPMARIMEWQKEKEGVLTITTTTEHLAQRLGHAVEKAYDGKVRYDFSHENKLAHVYWHRD